MFSTGPSSPAFGGKGSFTRRDIKLDSVPGHSRYSPLTPGHHFTLGKRHKKGSIPYVDRNLDFRKGQKPDFTKVQTKDTEFTKANPAKTPLQWEAEVRKEFNQRKLEQSSGISTPASLLTNDEFSLSRVSTSGLSQPSSLTSSAVLTNPADHQRNRTRKDIHTLAKRVSTIFKKEDNVGEKANQLVQTPQGPMTLSDLPDFPNRDRAGYVTAAELTSLNDKVNHEVNKGRQRSVSIDTMNRGEEAVERMRQLMTPAVIE